MGNPGIPTACLLSPSLELKGSANIHIHSQEMEFNFQKNESDFVVAAVHNSQIQVSFVKNKGTVSANIFFHTIVSHLAIRRIVEILRC